MGSQLAPFSPIEGQLFAGILWPLAGGCGSQDSPD
jgi:hypothetical protein